jgi:hypothetical protein
MSEHKSSVVVAVTSGGFWGKGEDLESAISKARQAGATRTQSAVIYIYHGEKIELEKITVDSYGSIQYPMTCESYRVGHVRIPMNQPKKVTERHD